MAAVEKPQLDQVYAALSVLYSPGSADKGATEKASTYLVQIQQSVWAWELADTLLQQNKSRGANHYASTTLRNKIQREFRELPAASHTSLRQSLMQHLVKYRAGEAVLLTQLSLALADLALQMNSWTTIVPDLVSQLSTDTKLWNVLLECLTVLPEEVGSRHLKLGAARREEVTSQLQQHSATVFAFLEFVMGNLTASETHDTTLNHVFKCWGSWLFLGEFDAKAVAGGQILPRIFEIITGSNHSHKCYEAASDAVCSATYAMEDLHVNRELALQIVPRLSAFHQPLVRALKDEDADVVKNIVRILTEAGESLIAQLTTTPGKELGDLTLVSLVLMGIKYPDYSVAEVSLNFWFQLAEHVYRAPHQEIVETFKPVYLELLSVIVNLCEMSEEREEGSFEDEDFNDFREKCWDLMKEIVYVVGVVPVISSLVTEVEATPYDNWKRLESLFFCSSTIIKILDSGDTQIVYRFLTKCLQTSEASRMELRSAAIKFTGECSEWIVSDTQILTAVLQKILTELRVPKLSSQCMTTLDKLCQLGGQQLQAHLDVLLEIVQHCGDVPLSTQTNFIQTVTGVCCHKPVPEQSALLLRLASRPILSLEKATEKTVVKDVDCISSIFRGYKGDVAPTDPHPLLELFRRVWPHLLSAMSLCARSVNDTERVCRCIRYALRVVGQRVPDVLDSLAAGLIQLYTVQAHSCVLYLSSVIVDEFSSHPTLTDGLLGLFSAMGPKTFEILSAQHGLERNPDTVDDFFRLCCRYMQHLGPRIVNSGIMDTLVEIGTMCLTLQNKEAQGSAVKFLDMVLQRAAHDGCETSKELLRRRGQHMVNQVVLGISGGIPGVLLKDPVIFLHDLVAAFGEEGKTWLRYSMGTIPIGVYVTQAQVEELYTKIASPAIPTFDLVVFCKEINRCFS